MTATLPPLSRASLPAGAGPVPATPPEAGIVHLGLGNFHRAHQAVYTAAALAAEPGPWGIVGAANASREVADAMSAQDLLYSVVEISPGGAEVSLPAVHAGTLVAADDPGRLVTHLSAEATRVVTLTITEHGYTYSPRTLGLDLDSPQVRHDLADQHTPRTPIGQITRALLRRSRTHGRGLTVVSCDNLVGNGAHTRRLVLEFAAALPQPGAQELVDWIDANVTFPNTMVDRIVPATSQAHRDLAAARLGLRDAIPVPAEPFTMWVLEDHFAAGRPRWEAGGAIFTDDVADYELLKLRLLNGTHSLIAYLGVLAGAATIPDSVALPFVESAARQVMTEDYLPTLTVPDTIDVDHYIEQLFQRFGNSALGHRTTQVGSDGSLKLPQRITEPTLLHCAQGRVPDHIALTVAAYLACVAPLGTDPAPAGARDIRDPAQERLARLGADARDAKDLVDAVFTQGGVFAAELADQRAFLHRIAEFVDILRRFGPEAAVAEARG